MIALPLLKISAVAELYNAISSNLELYRSGNFENLAADHAKFIDGKCEIDEEQLLNVHCTAEDQNEVQCCLAVYRGLAQVTPYLARDERLWTRLTHIELLDYARTRWPIPVDNERAVAHIQKHFFAKSSRGIERDNAASRLWWMAALCHTVQGMSHEEALTAFLFQSDVRANIIERPTTSQNEALFSALVKKLSESFHSDQRLYERRRFREVMKQLNLRGGVTLLEVVGPQDLEQLVQSATEKA